MHSRSLPAAIVMAVPVLIVAAFAELIALSLGGGVRTVILHAGALALVAWPLGRLIWHLTGYYHAWGMVEDHAVVERVLAENPGMPREMAEVMVGRARLGRGMLRTGGWMTGLGLAAAGIAVVCQWKGHDPLVGGWVVLSGLGAGAMFLWLAGLAMRLVAISRRRQG